MNNECMITYNDPKKDLDILFLGWMFLNLITKYQRAKFQNNCVQIEI